MFMLTNDHQELEVTGSFYKISHLEKRLEVISALLSLFDLQERVHEQLQFFDSLTEGSGSGLADLDEDYSSLTSMQILLDSVIEDSCNYVIIRLLITCMLLCSEFETCCNCYRLAGQ